MGNSKLLQVVKDIITYMQSRALENETSRDDMIKDHIKISRKIALINFLKISRLIIQIMFIAYYIS